MAGVVPPDFVSMDDDAPLLEGKHSRGVVPAISSAARLRALPMEASQRYDVRSCEDGGCSDGGLESGKRVRFFDFSAEEGSWVKSTNEGGAMRSPKSPGGGVAEGGAMRSPKSPRGGGAEGGAMGSPRGGVAEGGAMRSPRNPRGGGAPASPGSPSGTSPQRRAVKSSTRLHVGFLPLSITKQQLLEKFSPFGSIRDCVVIPPKPGLSYTYGFVEYASTSSALTAMQQLHNSRWEELCMTVRWSNAERQTGVGAGERDRSTSSVPVRELDSSGVGVHSVQVRHLPPTSTEAVLRRVFARAGAVKNVWIMKPKPLSETLSCILDFATLEEARRAVRMMDGRAIGGYTISVKPDNTALLRTQHHQHATEVCATVLDSVRRSNMAAITADSSQGASWPPGQRATGLEHRSYQLLKHPSIPNDVVVDFSKRLPPYPPQPISTPTSPTIATATSVHEDHQELPPLIRAPSSNLPQAKLLAVKDSSLHELPPLIGAPCTNFTQVEVGPGMDSGLASTPATSTSGEANTLWNGMEPSRMENGPCVLDPRCYQPVPYVDSSFQTWNNPHSMSVTYHNSNPEPNPQTQCNSQYSLPSMLQPQTAKCSSDVGNSLLDRDQLPALEGAHIREDASQHSPQNLQASTITQPPGVPSHSSPTKMNTCFAAETSPKEETLSPVAEKPTTQIATVSYRPSRQQSNSGIGRGETLLRLLEAHDALKKSVAPKSKAVDGAVTSRASPPPKTGLGRAQLMYSLYHQLSGNADTQVSRHERTVGGLALQRETKNQAVDPLTSRSTTPTSSMIKIFHLPSFKDISVTDTSQSPPAAATADSPLPPLTDNSEPQKQQRKKVKKPKIAAVFPGSSHTISSPLHNTPSPPQVDTPNIQTESQELGSSMCLKSPSQEIAGARVIGVDQQPATLPSMESSPPPLLLQSPSEGHLVAPSDKDSPFRSPGEWSPKSKRHQTISSSDELEGGESRHGRSSHEIEKSIALHQRNIHRWQAELKRIQQKNSDISDELSRELAAADDGDDWEEDEAATTERLRSFDRMLELQSQLVTEIESSKRREIDRELILMKGQQKYMGDKLPLLELKLELEAGDVWDKLTLAKLENKAVRAKAELFI